MQCVLTENVLADQDTSETEILANVSDKTSLCSKKKCTQQKAV